MEVTESAQKNQSTEKEDSSVTVAKVSLSMGQLAKMWTSATVEMCKLKWLKNIGISKFKTLYVCSCGDHGDCVNTHGSYECRCHSGFELTASEGASGATCTDINECLEEGRCGHEGSCRYARSIKSKKKSI